MADKYTVTVENAPRIWAWLKTRGGIAIWKSINLSNPGASWTTPNFDAEGEYTTRPNWQCSQDRERVITDPAEVEVAVPKLIKRFHVGVRIGAQGLQLKVTDGGTRRIRSELAKAGRGAWYEFDYDSQDALIYAPGAIEPISVWAARTYTPETKDTQADKLPTAGAKLPNADEQAGDWGDS